MNYKQFLALFLMFVIILSPIIVSKEKDNVVNVKSVDNSTDEYKIEEIVKDENNKKINIYYPVTKNDKANCIIKDKIDSYIDKFNNLENYEDEKELSISFESYNSGNIISFKFNVDMNIGITHKTNEIFTVVYEGDNVIDIASLTKNNPQLIDELYDVCKEKLEENDNFKKYSNENWLEKGLKKNNDTFSNFIFDNNNMIIIFNPYTVAPYVAGIFEVEISCNLN